MHHESAINGYLAVELQKQYYVLVFRGGKICTPYGGTHSADLDAVLGKTTNKLIRPT